MCLNFLIYKVTWSINVFNYIPVCPNYRPWRFHLFKKCLNSYVGCAMDRVSDIPMAR